METIRWKTFKYKTVCVVIVVLILITLLFNWLYVGNVLRKNISPISYDPKFSVDTLESSRLVWPEQLPYGDRIREQLFYIPKGYEYEMTPIKQILIQTGMGEDWENVMLGQGAFIGCAVSQCWLTLDQSLGPEVDALLFRHNFTKVKFIKPRNQIWIMEFTEAPCHRSPLPIDAIDLFNWTASYRWDSDIPIPYGYFMEHKPHVSQIRVDFPKTKTKKVAWFVSNCTTNNTQIEYANELAKHIHVDTHGKCGNLECPRSNEDACFERLGEDYKFYLAFENENCRHYITEKFFNALKHKIIPIVMGPSREDYEMMAPKNSFIHVDDFASPEKLAAYLHVLDKDDNLYEEYFQWQKTGTVIAGIFASKFYCRLCAMLHDEDRAPKHYEDINEWWRNGACQPDPQSTIKPNNR